MILDLSVFQSYLLRKTPSFLSYFLQIFFEFFKFKTENSENFRNSISRLLPETEYIPAYRTEFVGKFNPGC